MTGTELLAACVPIFELANGLSSCDGDGVAAGQWSKLLGVSCVDMNIIVDLPTLEAHAQYPQFKAAYEAAAKSCPTIVISDSVRADMQARVGAAGGSCSGSYPARDKCPAGDSCKVMPSGVAAAGEEDAFLNPAVEEDDNFPVIIIAAVGFAVLLAAAVYKFACTKPKESGWSTVRARPWLFY